MFSSIKLFEHLFSEGLCLQLDKIKSPKIIDTVENFLNPPPKMEKKADDDKK